MTIIEDQILEVPLQIPPLVRRSKPVPELAAETAHDEQPWHACMSTLADLEARGQRSVAEYRTHLRMEIARLLHRPGAMDAARRCELRRLLLALVELDCETGD